MRRGRRSVFSDRGLAGPPVRSPLDLRLRSLELLVCREAGSAGRLQVAGSRLGIADDTKAHSPSTSWDTRCKPCPCWCIQPPGRWRPCLWPPGFTSLEKLDAKADHKKERNAILNALLTIPVTATPNWSEAEKQQELDNTIHDNLGKP